VPAVHEAAWHGLNTPFPQDYSLAEEPPR